MVCLPRADYPYPQEVTDAMKKTEPKAYSTDDARWKAVLSRDASADGAFY